MGHGPGLRGKVTYANVVATIALFLALGGGSFAIAAALKKDSVGTKQIAKNAVKTKEIANEAVTGKKIGPGAVNAAKLAAGAVGAGALADNSVTGAKVDESTLGPVPEATTALNVLSAVVKPDGTLAQSTQNGTTSVRAGAGSYIVDFSRNMTACTATATIGNMEANPPPNPPTPPPVPISPIAPEPGLIGTSRAIGNDEAIAVTTRNADTPFTIEDHGFQLTVVC